MKFLTDLLPVFAFFVAFKLGKSFPEQTGALVTSAFGAIAVSATFPDMVAVIFATAAAIVITLVEVGWLLTRGRTIKPTLWLSAGLIVIFGTLTIWLQNEWFIKWKPSLLYWSFALILVAGQLLFRRNLLGSILGSELDLPPRVWDRMLWAWAGFFAALGAANLYVAYHYSTDQWVNFKTFGLLGLTFAFVLGMGFYMARHIKVEPDAQ